MEQADKGSQDVGSNDSANSNISTYINIYRHYQHIVHGEYDESMKSHLESIAESCVKLKANQVDPNCNRVAHEDNITLKDPMNYLDGTRVKSPRILNHTAALVASMEERISYLEEFIVGWLKEHRTHLKFNEATHVKIERRLESLEALGTADRHAKESLVESALDELKKEAHSLECTTHKLEDSFGKASDVLRRHEEEIEIAKKKLGDLDRALDDGARHSRLASVEERMNFLEQSMTESADKLSEDLKDTRAAHGEHKTSVKVRLESIEALIRRENAKEIVVPDTTLSDADEKHRIAKKLGGFDNELGAQRDHLVNIEKRVRLCEKRINESSHTLKELRKDCEGISIANAEHKAATETRLEFLSTMISDRSDNHEKGMETSTNYIWSYISDNSTPRKGREANDLCSVLQAESVSDRLGMIVRIDTPEDSKMMTAGTTSRPSELQEDSALHEQSQETLEDSRISLENTSTLLRKLLGDLALPEEFENTPASVFPCSKMLPEGTISSPLESQGGRALHEQTEDMPEDSKDRPEGSKAMPEGTTSSFLELQDESASHEHSENTPEDSKDTTKVSKMLLEATASSLLALHLNIDYNSPVEKKNDNEWCSVLQAEGVSGRLGMLADSALNEQSEDILPDSKMLPQDTAGSLLELEGDLALHGRSADNSKMLLADTGVPSRSSSPPILSARSIGSDVARTMVRLAMRQDDEQRTARQLNSEECESPARTFAMLHQDLQNMEFKVEPTLHEQSEDRPGYSEILPEGMASRSVVESLFEDEGIQALRGDSPLPEPSARLPENICNSSEKNESQSEDETAEGVQTMLTLLEQSNKLPSSQPKAELQSEDVAVVDDNASEWLQYHQVEDVCSFLGSWSYDGGIMSITESASRLYFNQHGFSGEIKKSKIGGWLEVYITPAKGTIRIKIDHTGNFLRIQFKRKGESTWRKSVCAQRGTGASDA